MTDVTGDFMRHLRGFQHGDFFIAVYEINSPRGADCFYGWDSETGSYIGRCGPHPDYHDAECPTTFSLCLGSSPGDVIFRFDDPDGDWLLALAARLSAQLAKLEMPAVVRECLQRVVASHGESGPADEAGSDGELGRAVSTIRDWLKNGSTRP